MTEIQVLIPLSVFGDAKDLTPQGISDAITQVSEFKSKIAEQTAKNDVLVDTIRMIGNRLESIWLDSRNDLERAKAIRELFADLKEFKG